jgi:cytochrome c biogenesis protein CcmG, thiol:disulfide interchange protein DsbE
MRRRSAACVLAVTGLLAGCTADGDGSGRPGRGSPPAAEQSALLPCPDQPDEASAAGGALPDLRFDCLGGGSFDLGRAPGAPTVVNLWASWCGPCREELPLLQQLADEAGEQVQVIGVVSRDGVPQAESFAAEAGVTFPGAFDRDGELMAELGLPGLPYTVFLAADGSLVHSEVGQLDSATELRGLVAEHLGVAL